MTIHRIWIEAVRRHAALPALGWVGAPPWTFAEVDRRVRTLQARFCREGLAAGDRVALWSPNHPGWGVVYLGITTGPWVVVPLLPEFSAHDAANVLIHAEAKVLVASRVLAEVWKQWFAAAPEEQRAALAGLRLEVLEDLAEVTPSAEAVEDAELPRPSPSDLAALIYTSGTTGASKGVMLTHANIASNIVAAAPIVGFVPGDKMLSVLPLAHTYECTLGFLIPMHEGIHVSYLAKPPSSAVLLPALALVRPHAMLTVPLFMEKIYRQKVLPGLNKGILRMLRKIPGLGWTFNQIAGAKLRKTFGGRLKFFGIGGAPLAPEVARFLHRSRFPYAIGYGLTETSPLIAGHLKGRLYTTGRVLEGVQVKIGEPKNQRGAGEILVKGPNVMAGYYKSPVQTAEAFNSDGWFRTGDLGLFDSKSQLCIMGRSKNLILGPSGENIYPEVIEALINQDRLVSESLVLQRGPEIVAKIVIDHEVLHDQLRKWSARRGKTLAAWGEDTGKAVEEYLTELKHQINQQLSRFSRLSFVEVQREPFEKTATLKIKRYLYA
jgi:long-chain acyl-CoA synthetase